MVVALFALTAKAHSPSAAEVRFAEPQLDRVQDAKRLFQQRSLTVPTVEIRFHDDESGCNGHIGYFRARQRRIDICSDLPFVLIHELAHAWIEDNVSPAIKQEFVHRNDLSSWNDHADEWGDRGTELAAHAIQQVVMRDLDPGRTRNQKILANYNLLTQPTAAVRSPS